MSVAYQLNPTSSEIALVSEKVRLSENFALGDCVGEKPAVNDCCVGEKVRLAENRASGVWFSAKDPIGFAGGDTNLYGYVISDPVNYLDQTGLSRARGGRSASGRNSLFPPMGGPVTQQKTPSGLLMDLVENNLPKPSDWSKFYKDYVESMGCKLVCNSPVGGGGAQACDAGTGLPSANSCRVVCP